MKEAGLGGGKAVNAAVNFHHLESLREVREIGGQARAARDETHEENPLGVREIVQNLGDRKF